jgi:hypothetical protein
MDPRLATGIRLAGPLLVAGLALAGFAANEPILAASGCGFGLGCVLVMMQVGAATLCVCSLVSGAVLRGAGLPPLIAVAGAIAWMSLATGGLYLILPLFTYGGIDLPLPLSLATAAALVSGLGYATLAATRRIVARPGGSE